MKKFLVLIHLGALIVISCIAFLVQTELENFQKFKQSYIREAEKFEISSNATISSLSNVIGCSDSFSVESCQAIEQFSLRSNVKAECNESGLPVEFRLSGSENVSVSGFFPDIQSFDFNRTISSVQTPYWYRFGENANICKLLKR